MEYARQTIASAELVNIIKLPPALRNKRVEVIVLPVADAKPEPPKCQRKIGFMPGPELPDSFFEPLPEEELQAWGL